MKPHPSAKALRLRLRLGLRLGLRFRSPASSSIIFIFNEFLKWVFLISKKNFRKTLLPNSKFENNSNSVLVKAVKKETNPKK